MRLDPEFVFPTATQSGSIAAGSPTVTGLSDTSQLIGATLVAAPGVPFGAAVATIDSPTQVTLTAPALASSTGPIVFRMEPLDLATTKHHLRLEIPDDDALVARLITTARLNVENMTGRALITQARTMFLDSFPSAGGYYNRAVREIWPSMGGLPSGLGFYPGLVPNSTGVINLLFPPIQSATVQYTDFAGLVQTVDPAAYNISLGSPGRLQPQYSHVWPISRPTIDSVQIHYVSGYGDTADKVPEPFRSAMLLLIGHWYEHREEFIEGHPLYTVPGGIARNILASVESGLYY